MFKFSTMNEARTVNELRDRLRGALRTGDAYAVREEVINILADLGSGRVMVPEPEECCADTMRCPVGPDFEPDSAPPIPLTRPSGGP